MAKLISARNWTRKSGYNARHS